MKARGGARCLGGLGAAGLIAAVILGLAASGPARAGSPPTPWDGTNPFNCTIQDAGQGTKVPDPGADPYCVSFDKTNQNVTQLGLVQFLSLEPARTAAAVPKCFYFQEDHWRGSVVQSDGSTVLYEFYGHYFFDKATGDGGAWVTGFSLAGRTFDPAALPGFPPTYGQYFGPGTGGFITHNGIPADPSCVAKASAHPASIYTRSADVPRCAAGHGSVTSRGIGPVALGETEARVRAALGPPQTVKRGFLGYCVTGGGSLFLGEPGDRSGTYGSDPDARVAMLLTSAHGYAMRDWRGRVVRVDGRSLPLGGRRSPWRLLIRSRGAGAWIRRGNRLADITFGRRSRIVYLGVYARRAIPSLRSLIGYLEHVQ